MLPVIGKLGLVLTLLFSTSCANDETIEEEGLLTEGEQASELISGPDELFKPQAGLSYYFQNRGSNKFLTSSSAKSSGVHTLYQRNLYGDNTKNDTRQVFKLFDAGDGYFYVRNKATADWLTIRTNPHKNGTGVTLEPDLYTNPTSVDLQKWEFSQSQSAVYEIKNKNTGKLMEVEDFKTGNFANVQQWDDKDHGFQKWSFRRDR